MRDEPPHRELQGDVNNVYRYFSNKASAPNAEIRPASSICEQFRK